MGGIGSLFGNSHLENEIAELKLALEESHNKLAAIDKVQATIEFEPTGVILGANQNFLSAMGYSESEIVGKHHSMFVDPKERDTESYKNFWACLASGESFSAEYKRINKKGEEIWIQASYNALKNKHGEVYKVVKYASDITEIKVTGVENKAKVNAISRAMATIEFKPDGTILTANENFLGAVGYSLSEIVGKHHSMFVSKKYSSSDEYKSFWQSLGKGEYNAGEFERVNKKGQSIWIQASYNPIFDQEGKIAKVVKFASDITEQKNMANQNSAIMDAIGKSQAVIEFDPSGKILTANQNFLSTLGYTLPEIQGKHHSIFVDEKYASSPSYQDFWMKLGNGIFDSGEYERKAKDGSSIWIQATYNPLFDASGNVVKVIKFATDITAGKEQAAINRKNADISSALKLCSANVMLVDLNQDVVYLNEEASRMFVHREASIRSAKREY